MEEWFRTLNNIIIYIISRQPHSCRLQLRMPVAECKVAAEAKGCLWMTAVEIGSISGLRLEYALLRMLHQFCLMSSFNEY